MCVYIYCVHTYWCITNILIYIFIVYRYLNESSSVESISTKLRQVCPSIYQSEDAACTKVNIIVLMFLFSSE